jgi:ribosomal protein L10
LSLNRSEKEAVISEVTGLAAKAQTLVIAEYRGITVADMTKLRNDARSKGVSLSVLKNTLARRAVAGSAFEVVSDQMTGPLIYGFSEDAVAAAKVVAEFAKTNDKLVIRGRCVRWQGPGRERREATGQHSHQGSVAGAVVGLDACPPFPVRPWCWVRWRRKKARRSSRRSSCRVNAAPVVTKLVRKSKWHSIKTHF